MTVAAEAITAVPALREPHTLGWTMLQAHGVLDVHPGAWPVVTANYVSPTAEMPLPSPDGDWYLRQTFVPAASAGETVVCHTLIPGLRDYYGKIGLIPSDADVIEVEPGESGYGFPATDPLESLKSRPLDSMRQFIMAASVEAPAYLCSTFNGSEIDEQAAALGLVSLDRADSTLTNHKARLRDAAAEYGIDMLPGMNIQTPEDVASAVSAPWNSGRGTWLKFPTGSGGDLVIRIRDAATPETLGRAIGQLRASVQKAFDAGTFSRSFEDFWPEGALAPADYPLVLEADASYMGQVLAVGSTQAISHKDGEVQIVGHFKLMTTPDGEYLGNEPYADISEEAARQAEDQTRAVARYQAERHGFYAWQGVDWFLVRDWSGQVRVITDESNARPTANTPPVIMAQKLGAKHFVNTNIYGDKPIQTIQDYIDLVGEDLAFGDPSGNGMVVPQAFRTMVRDAGVMPSPNFKVAIFGRDSEHCHAIMDRLHAAGLRFEP